MSDSSSLDPILAEGGATSTDAPASRADIDLAHHVAAGDTVALESLIRTHNRALFRAARAILRDDADAEEALQDTYVAACAHIADFRGESSLSTWLTRIVINQALGRLRKSGRGQNRVVIPFDEQDRALMEASTDTTADTLHGPELEQLRNEVRHLLERAIDGLPLAYRTVFVLREVEQMTVDETGRVLALSAATVRTRLFRAKALLRSVLSRELDLAADEVFGFAGARCDRIVAAVLGRVWQRTVLP